MYGFEKDNLRQQFKNDNMEAAKRARDMVRKLNGGGAR